MTTLRLKPKRGGFLLSFDCGWFIREFLLGNGLHGSQVIDPEVGAPQAEIFYHYKNVLHQETAMGRATRAEEKRARHKKRSIDRYQIEQLYQRCLSRIPYKANGCRYHSFITYFSTLRRLGWVEPTGQEELSAFQEHYAAGQPRRYYRLTKAGLNALDGALLNLHLTLYG